MELIYVNKLVLGANAEFSSLHSSKYFLPIIFFGVTFFAYLENMFTSFQYTFISIRILTHSALIFLKSAGAY